MWRSSGVSLIQAAGLPGHPSSRGQFVLRRRGIDRNGRYRVSGWEPAVSGRMFEVVWFETRNHETPRICLVRPHNARPRRLLQQVGAWEEESLCKPLTPDWGTVPATGRDPRSLFGSKGTHSPRIR